MPIKNSSTGSVQTKSLKNNEKKSEFNSIAYKSECCQEGKKRSEFCYTFMNDVVDKVFGKFTKPGFNIHAVKIVKN